MDKGKDSDVLYNILKRKVERGETGRIIEMLEVFYAAERIGLGQYEELIGLVNGDAENLER